MSDNDLPPQDEPFWVWSRHIPGYYCNVWLGRVEIDICIKRTHHRWGWEAKSSDLDRLAGSFSTRFSREDTAIWAAERWLEAERTKVAG